MRGFGGLGCVSFGLVAQLVLVVVTSLLILPCYTLFAQCELAVLGASDDATHHLFGDSVVMSGGLMVVGAPGDNAAGEHSGAAYVYRQEGTAWIREARLLGDDTQAGHEFGTAVSISGDTVAVGAGEDIFWSPGAAAAYVFRRIDGNWVQEARLSPSDAGVSASFGRAVSLSGETLVVGSPGMVRGLPPHDWTDVPMGSAHIFRRGDAGWTEEARLSAPDGVPFDHFGDAVAVDGDTIVIGARGKGDGEGAEETGAAYVFHREGTEWVFQIKLTGDDPRAFDRFGRCVALDGSLMAIGASMEGGAGAVHLFQQRGGSWVRETKLEPDRLLLDGFFGSSVALKGDVLVAGAIGVQGVGSVLHTLGLGAGSTYVFRRLAGEWVAEMVLLDEERTGRDRFGWSVALGDELVAVSAARCDDSGVDSGAVLVFERSEGTWVKAAELSASGAGEGDLFGSSVAESGQWAVVGAPGDDDLDRGRDAGSASVFHHAGHEWTKEAKLWASDADAEDHFGSVVLVDGDVVFVGAVSGDGEEPGSGAGYVFRRGGDGWLEEAKIAAADGTRGDRFGAGGSLAGDTLAVGAPLAPAPGGETGAVYVFGRVTGQWVERAKLSPSEASANSRFGESIDLYSATMVVGAPGDDGLGSEAGAVYVFRRDGVDWTQQARLSAGDGGAGQRFGFSVSVDDDLIVAGAPGAPGTVTDSGAAYVFRREGTVWTEQGKLVYPTGSAGDLLGFATHLSDGVIVLGVPGHAAATGLVCIFSGHEGRWLLQSTHSATDASPGLGYGSSLFLGDSGIALIGAPGGIDGGVRAGALYSVQVVAQEDCDGSGTDDFCDLLRRESDDCNLNGIPDECDVLSGVAVDSDGDGRIDDCGTPFRRGDFNADGAVDISDPIAILGFFFVGAEFPSGTCPWTADANASGSMDIADPIYLLAFLFSLGSAPPYPFPDCGVTSEDCEVFEAC